jgi:polyisoprenoid-binding protein YceI
MVTTAPVTTTWQIDTAHSVVEFAVKHMMFATAKGRFGQFSGDIVFDPADIAGSSVHVEIDVKSIDTRDEKRDGHLLSPDFFDAENYPTITFKSTRVEPTGDSEFKVYGDLTIHGITHEAVLNAEFTGQGKNPWGQEVIGFSATTKFKRSDFGLEWNAALETGGVLVGDEVKIAIEIEAARQA